MEDLINDKQTKVCTKCGKEFPIENFYKSSHSKDGHQSYCKACSAASSAASFKKRSSNKPILAMPQPRNFEGGNPDLAGFTPRQLIEELKVRGYEGELRYTYHIKV